MSFDFSYNSIIYKISFVGNQCEFYGLKAVFWDHGQPVNSKVLETYIGSHVIDGHYPTYSAEILLCYWSVFVLASCVPYLYFYLLSIHHYVLYTVVNACGANYVFWKFPICETAYDTWFAHSCISNNQYFYYVICRWLFLSFDFWGLFIKRGWVSEYKVFLMYFRFIIAFQFLLFLIFTYCLFFTFMLTQHAVHYFLI